MKSVSLIFGFLVVLFSLLLWWGVGKSLPRDSDLEITHNASFEDAAPTSQLKLATYNIGYAQGVKATHTDWRDEPYTRQKLTELSEVIQHLDADILLLQEVDLDSNRSHYINQAEYLAREAQYPYSACAVVWDENYVPFPFWPIAHQLGKTKTANCIFSRFPIRSHQRHIFDKPASNPFWYNWGYLDRGTQEVQISIGEQLLTVVNLHLEAFEQEAREKQAGFFAGWTADVKGPLVLGGDFNGIPSTATKKDHFVDEPDISYATDNTMELFRAGFDSLTETLSTSLCSVKEHLCLTFPANNPTRRLDYMFATRGAKFVDGRVAVEAGDASDHLPVVGIIEMH